MSTPRATYESLLAEHVLNKTRDAFGPFHMEVNYLQVSYDRGRREVAAGEIVNFFTNPLPVKRLPMDSELNIIPVPVMKGLLGYRVLIVKRKNVDKYRAISRYEDLKKFSAGQVNDWADVAIYQENGLPVVQGTSFESLFYMLSRDRFDYIPLSAGEAEKTLEELKTQYKDLVIVPNLVIYYPFPVFFQVSKNHPQLSRRLSEGVKLASADGTLDRLFKQYFSDVLILLNSPDIRLFELYNPNLPPNYPFVRPVLTSTRKVVSSPKLLQERSSTFPAPAPRHIAISPHLNQ